MARMRFPPEDRSHQLGALFVVLSNFSMLLPATSFWRRGFYLESVLGLFALVSSFLYHTLQTFDTTLMGAHNSRYHVADNIFAISSFCLCLLLFLHGESPYILESLKAFFIGLVILAQCLNPWNPNIWMSPVTVNLAFVVAWFIAKRKLPNVAPREITQCFVVLTISLWFFVKGLDDDLDEYKVYHACWHIGASIFGYMFLHTVVPAKHQRRLSGVSPVKDMQEIDPLKSEV